MNKREVGSVAYQNLDSELDRLYRGEPSAFVADRNKLAQALRAAGDRAAADEVARLTRPSPVAWLINQLHFRAPSDLQALFEAGAALRRAQESAADSEEFAARKRAHHEALRRTADRAAVLAEDGGVSVSANLRRRLELTLGVLSSAEDVRPPPGRLFAELEPLGFDALTHVAASPVPRRPKQVADDPVRVREAAALKAAVEAAAVEARRLEQEAKRSRAMYERAAREADEAEARATAARSVAEDAKRAAEATSARLEAALRLLEEARSAEEER